MHQLNKKTSEFRIEGVKLFQRGVTKVEIKGDDTEM